MDLLKASNQWSIRPSEERFWTVADMLAATRYFHEQALEAPVVYGDLRVEAVDNDINLIGKRGLPAQVSHFAFGQLCQRAGAPPSYLRKLPATLACQNLNHGLKAKAGNDDNGKLLLHRNGSLLLRAALTDKYERLWNDEVLEALLKILPDGWRLPPARPAPGGDKRARPATEADLLNRNSRGGGLSINLGDMIGPAGAYASDKDMFLFLVNEQNVVNDGTPEGLAQGIMLWNSEVGDMSFGGMKFRYKHVCGNHIVWDASDVTEFRIPHIGKASRDKAFKKIEVEIVQYANASVSDVEAQIAKARTFQLGATREEAIEAVLSFGRAKKIVGLTEDRLGDAFDAAEAHVDWYKVAPTTVWGMVQGLTEVSQRATHTDDRLALDRAAGKVMSIAF